MTGIIYQINDFDNEGKQDPAAAPGLSFNNKISDLINYVLNQQGIKNQNDYSIAVFYNGKLHNLNKTFQEIKYISSKENPITVLLANKKENKFFQKTIKMPELHKQTINKVPVAKPTPNEYEYDILNIQKELEEKTKFRMNIELLKCLMSKKNHDEIIEIFQKLRMKIIKEEKKRMRL